MLKRWKVLITALITSLLTPLAPAGTASAAKWRLVWSDEFRETSLNTANWDYDTGNGSGGWGNNELEYYTNRAANVQVKGGNLVITAIKESCGGYDYTSGRIKTKGKLSWTYGRITARIKIPEGIGLWPAFWMLGSNIDTVAWPKCGEIDIMEHVNTNIDANGTMHWDSNGHQYYGQTTPQLDFSKYHIYTIEWDPKTIKWFADGIKYCEADIAKGIHGTEEFQKPHFILLNLAVGGRWPGSPGGNTVFPAKMLVDYVRVYADTSSPAQVRMPLLSPASGTYRTAINIRMSCATKGAIIRYTMDGSEPTATSLKYSSAVSVASTKVIKAKAFKEGAADSAAAVGLYTVKRR